MNGSGGKNLEKRIQALQKDIKELREEKRTLTAEFSQYTSLLDEANDIIYTHDATGQFISANGAVERHLGYSQEEIGALNIKDILPPESLAKAQESIAKKMGGLERTTPYEIEVYRKDGTSLWLEVNTRVITEKGQIKAIQGIARDVTARREMDEMVRHQAFHDPLTGLPNRRLFFDRLQVAIGNARRNEEMVAVFFLDVDRFKSVNDSLGHDVGDLLIQGIGNRLVAAMRDCDTVSRLGGDEFALFIPHLQRTNDAARFARRVIKAFANPFACKKHRLFVTPSIGISLFPSDGERNEMLLRNADMAMYRAKDHGGNGFQFFHDEMNQQAHRRLALENALRAAIDREELSLRFQPRVSLPDHQIASLEAVVHMPGELADLVESDQLISLASETGLVMALGQWVLKNTCAQIRQWMDAGVPMVPVALKITGRQFLHSPIVDNVRRTLEEAGVPAHHLLLELVETGGRVDPDLIAMKFNALRDLGVTVSVDHFSPNHTSLSAFQGDASDYVVIGRGLTADLFKSPRSAAITNSIIALAQELGVITVAQGVSNAVQLLWLQEAGCDMAQGPHCGDAMSAQDVATQLMEPESQSSEEVA